MPEFSVSEKKERNKQKERAKQGGDEAQRDRARETKRSSATLRLQMCLSSGNDELNKIIIYNLSPCLVPSAQLCEAEIIS